MSGLKCFFVLIAGLGISSCGFTRNETIDNICAFSDIYGVCRWFIPSPEIKEYDWNTCAVEGIHKVRNCRNSVELIDTLRSIFCSIAPEVSIDKSETHRSCDCGSNPVFWQYKGGDISTLSTMYHSKLSGVPNKNLNVGRLALSYSLQPSEINKDTVTLEIIARKRHAESDLCAYAILDFDDNSVENHYINLLSRNRQIKLDLSENNKKFNLTFAIDRSNKSMSVDWGIYPDGVGELIISDIKFLDLHGNNIYDIDVCGFKGFWGEPDMYSYNVAGSELTVCEKQHLWEETKCRTEFIDIRISDTGYYAHIPVTLPTTAQFNKVIGLESKMVNDTDIRLADYVIAYNALYFFAPHFGDKDIDWNLLRYSDIAKILAGNKSLSPLKNLLGELHDSHAEIQPSDGFENIYPDEDYRDCVLPCIINEIDGKNVVVHSFCDELLNGDIIEAIDDGDVLMKDFISGSQQYHNVFPEFFPYQTDSLSKLTIIRDDKRMTMHVHGINYETYYQKESDAFRVNESRWLNDGLCYVNLYDISYEELSILLKDRDDNDTVIFDARKGQNNFLLNTILPFMKCGSLPVKRGNTWTPMVSFPKKCIPQMPHDNGLINNPGNPSKSNIILISAHNKSSAEDFLDVIKCYGMAYLIGQPTCGISGSINGIELPGRIAVRFTGERAYSCGGKETDFYLNGVQPDCFVPLKISDIKDGRDAVMENAIQISKEK